jgi:hypothetical protein
MYYLDSRSLAYLTSVGISNGDGNAGKTEALAKLDAALRFGAQIDAETVHFLIDVNDDNVGDQNSFAFWLHGNFNCGGVNATTPDRVFDYLQAGGAMTPELAPLLTNTMFAIDGDSGTFDPSEFYPRIMKALANGALTPGYAPPAAAVAALADAPDVLYYKDYNPSPDVTLQTWGSARASARTWTQNYFSYAMANRLPMDPALVQAYAGLGRTEAADWLRINLASCISNRADGSCPIELLNGYKDVNAAVNTNDPFATSAVQYTYPFNKLDPSFPGGHALTGWTWMTVATLRKAIDTKSIVNPDVLQQLDQTDAWAGNYIRWWALKQQATTGLPLDTNYLQQLNTTNPDEVAALCETALQGEDADGKTLNTDYLNLFATNDPPGATTFCEGVLNAEIAAHENLNPDCLNVVATNDPAAATDICDRELQDALRPTNALLLNTGAVSTFDVTSDRTPTIRVDLGGMGTPAALEGDTIYLYADGNTQTPVAQRALTAGEISQGFADVTPPAALLGGDHSITSQFTHPTLGTDGTTVTSTRASAESTPLVIAVEPNTLLTDTGGSNTDKVTKDNTPTIRIGLKDLVGLPGITTAAAAGDSIRVLVDGALSVLVPPLSSTNISNGYVDVTLPTLANGTRSITTTLNSVSTQAQLSIAVDTNAPTLSSAQYLGTTMMLTFNEPTGGSANGGDFWLQQAAGAGGWVLDAAGNRVTVRQVTVDADNAKVYLTLSAAPASNTAGVLLYYERTAGGLVDRAGNVVETIPNTIVGAATSMPPAVSSTLTYPNALVAPPSARAMDAAAMKVLQALNPALATMWQARFTTAGLVAKPAAAGPAPLDLSLDIDTLLWMVFTNRAKAVEDQLKQQIAITQQKNDTLGKLNELLGAMNEMDAAVPSGADSGNSLRSKLGDNYGTLRDKVNAACQTSGLQPFPGTSGQVDDSTTISQLRQAIQNLKAQIDSLANLQQLDMLRMQNLTTKRNESWDTISNQMEKSSSTRKAIIDNMR